MRMVLFIVFKVVKVLFKIQRIFLGLAQHHQWYFVVRCELVIQGLSNTIQ